MPDFTVTNAGSPDFNDDYTENGVNVGKPAYEGDVNGMWLYYIQFGPSKYGWVLDTAIKGGAALAEWDYYYGQGTQATPPEGTYTPGTGDAPGADVAVYVASGVGDKITNRTNTRMIFTGCNPRMMF